VRPSLFLDRLLRGRAWVALIAVLLTGIVFLNVALLELNGSIARMDSRAAGLKRENADLTMRVARLGSSERIQRAAAAQGFVGTPPGAVGYLGTREDDASAAARALERWRPPASAATPGDPSAPGGDAPSGPDTVGAAPGATPAGSGQTGGATP
jgi:cell division protein FtsL